MDHDLESNKKNAIAFYRTAYLGEPSKAVEDYVGSEYIQHNPLVADGNESTLAGGVIVYCNLWKTYVL